MPEAIMPECTELSVVGARLDLPLPTFDALEILVDEILRIAGPSN